MSNTSKPSAALVLYILQCKDDTLYTGITNNLEQRIAKHETGQGAKYTRGRGPFKILYTQEFPNRSAASSREYEIKRLSKLQKKMLSSNEAL